MFLHVFCMKKWSLNKGALDWRAWSNIAEMKVKPLLAWPVLYLACLDRLMKSRSIIIISQVNKSSLIAMPSWIHHGQWIWSTRGQILGTISSLCGALIFGRLVLDVCLFRVLRVVAPDWAVRKCPKPPPVTVCSFSTVCYSCRTRYCLLLHSVNRYLAEYSFTLPNSFGSTCWSEVRVQIRDKYKDKHKVVRVD